MKLSAIISVLENEYPPHLAEDWDNVGLLVGDADAEISSVLVSLDVTDEAVARAEELGAGLILTHHPLIFRPLKKVTEQDFIARRIRRMIRADINYYAMHTNFDLAGMADLNAADLGLIDPQILTETVHPGYGYGRIGSVSEPCTLRAFAERVREAAALPYIRVYGDPERAVSTAAVSSGAGKMSIDDALRLGADVLVTGDLDYHSAIDAAARGLATVDAGHYGTEYTFIRFMAGFMREHFPGLAVHEMEVRQPYIVV